MALDVPGLAEARKLIDSLEGRAGWLKVGSELLAAAGPSALEAAARDARVFLDTKLHDIPRTVAAAVDVATRQGVSMLTVHASGGAAMHRAARAAAETAAAAAGVARPILIGVTVLTSLGDEDLAAIGVADPVAAQVERLAALAMASGLDGVVCSAREARAQRERLGPEAWIVTPGVRAAGARDDQPDDQRRTASAAEAIRAGSSLVVVGRPVVRASDPAAAAGELLGEIEEALAG